MFTRQKGKADSRQGLVKVVETVILTTWKLAFKDIKRLYGLGIKVPASLKPTRE